MGKRKAPAGCYWRGATLWARTVVRGQEHRWSLKTDDPKLAQQRYKAGKVRLTARVHGDERVLFVSAFGAWNKWAPGEVGPRTFARYLCSLEQIAPFLEGKHVDEIDGKLVSEIIEGRRDLDEVSNATIKRDLTALSSVMNFCVDSNWAEENLVVARMKRIRERHDPITLPTDTSVDAVIAQASGAIRDLIQAALVTGARQEELAGVRASQLDLKAKRLTVVGKGNKLRVIDLEPFNGVTVFEQIARDDPGAYLFADANGERLRWVPGKFRDVRKATAEKLDDEDKYFTPFRFHDLRHLHAVRWLRSGRSIYDLQQRLGHASISTTEIYLDYLTPEEKRIVKGEVGSAQNPAQSCADQVTI